MDLDLPKKNEKSCSVKAVEKPPVLQNLELPNADHSKSSPGTRAKFTPSKVKIRDVGNIAQRPTVKMKPADVLRCILS